MSFILDALKKAEAERQRQTGPTLLEVRVHPSRRRFPLWILVIAGLLGINMVLLLVFLLRKPPAASAPAASAVAAPSVAAPSVAAASAVAPAGAAPAPQGPVLSAPPATAPAIVGSAQSPYPAAPYPAAPYPTQPYPGAQYPGTPYPGSPYAQSPYAAPAAPGAQVPYAPAGYAPGVGSYATAQPAAPDAEADNPADYEPAVTRPRAAGGRAEPPNLQELGGNMPDLRLDLHVYASNPSERYALINMHRVREGDTLPEGPRVIAIDRDGVELSYRGTEFMLRPQ